MDNAPASESDRYTDLFQNRKLVDRFRDEGFSRVHDGAWESRVIRRIREMLCFQAERAEFGVADAILAHDGAVQVQGGIELHAGLGGPDFHLTTCCGVRGTR